MDELLKDIPKDLHDRLTALVALIDAFCDLHLNAEYKELCRQMAVLLCKKRFPIGSGKVAGWAGAVIHAVGWVNFLHDPSQTPHMTSAEIAKQLDVSAATIVDKSRLIRNGLDLVPFQPEWTLRSKLAENPLVWMVELRNGLVIDIRSAPRELQEQALKAGLIPFLPEPPKGNSSR